VVEKDRENLFGGEKCIILLEGSQAPLACPSVNSTKVINIRMVVSGGLRHGSRDFGFLHNLEKDIFVAFRAGRLNCINLNWENCMSIT
jgi:hypothetical protein